MKNFVRPAKFFNKNLHWPIFKRKTLLGQPNFCRFNKTFFWVQSQNCTSSYFPTTVVLQESATVQLDDVLHYNVIGTFWISSIYGEKNYWHVVPNLGCTESFKQNPCLYQILKLFTFCYINRRKYLFRANFQLPVLGGFTLFGISWTRFDYFWKMSVCLCVCDKNFVASVAQELMHNELNEILYLEL